MIDELIHERKKKLDRVRMAGLDPYPADARRTHQIGEALKDFSKLEKKKKRVSLVGRVVAFRNQGNLFFLDLRDASGTIQLVVKKDEIRGDYALFRDTLDIGDFVEGAGILFKTKRGEKSVAVTTLRFLTKALRPIPSEWYGISDTETRLRRRYLDLLVNPSARDIFYSKARFWDATREFLKNQKFLEVETPVLEPIPGGADARPFITHHNALDTDFYLRISLELYQKRLLVGGFERVFEIGRIFRNEGIDAEHLQDYTQMEFYAAYASFEDLTKLVEKLYKTIITSAFGTLTITSNNMKVNWGKKWERIDYSEAFKKATGIDLEHTHIGALQKYATSLKLRYEPSDGMGRLIDGIYKKTVRPHIVGPAFLVNHPVVISPLAKRDPKNPHVTKRLQVLAYGSELGNGWAELNDPIDQRARFEEQSRLRVAGDDEAQMMDEDYVEAMEYGMPPAVGFGFSERLFAVLVGKPVRETVFFPSMRTKK
jgi:lysyl-tRNA synthetase class 2